MVLKCVGHQNNINFISVANACVYLIAVKGNVHFSVHFFPFIVVFYFIGLSLHSMYIFIITQEKYLPLCGIFFFSFTLP